jgi:O-antigen/teichoic acid export membrane protein
LIRKKDCTAADYSTVFYFNLVVGIFFYFVLFFTSNAISNYFNEPQLTKIIRVLAIVLIIDSLTIIQRTILIKRVDFKLQTKISVISSIISGSIGVTMAFSGFGVWSLVAKQIFQRITNSLLLWLWNRWRPILVFSWNSFVELFSFGYKLLISGLINTLYNNIYYLIIGKYFSARELGFYTRADQFNNLISFSLISVIGQVSFPVLAQMQDNIVMLKSNYKKMIKSSMLLSFVLLMGMAAIAEPMIITLIGEKWR